MHGHFSEYPGYSLPSLCRPRTQVKPDRMAAQDRSLKKLDNGDGKRILYLQGGHMGEDGSCRKTLSI